MSHKKKIAVMTSFYINNYGSVLQAYATKEFLNSLGLEVVFINYIRENVRNQKTVNDKWNTNFIRNNIYKIYKYVDVKLKDRVFKKFVIKNLNLTPLYENKQSLYDNIIDADIYCVGSDQMWNSEYNGGIIEENFLGFLPKEKKKISLSTSIGMSSFCAREKEQMKLLISDFQFISVREKEAVEIITEIGFEKVYQLLDPTLLISRNRWQELFVRKSKNRSDYILIYQLNNNLDMQNFARKLAKDNDLQIVQITYYMSQHWNDIKTIYSPSVGDFVSLIANAKYVVTDSFHGTAFSINLNKEFYSFNPNKYAGRIKSILELTGLEQRLVSDYRNYCFPEKINYLRVESVLNKCRKEAREVLESVIE